MVEDRQIILTTERRIKLRPTKISLGSLIINTNANIIVLKMFAASSHVNTERTLTLEGPCIIFCNIYIYIHTHSNEIHNVAALIVY